MMTRITLSLLLTLFVASSVQSQSWDYERYPERNVDFTHLDADIRITDNPLISGDVLYTARILRPVPDSIYFHAAGMNIINVELDNVPMEYRIRDNLLILDVENRYERGDVIGIRIQYDTNPRFGIHMNDHKTAWTSMLPKSIQHWIPIYDHPETLLTTDIVFSHPSELMVVTNGRRGDSELLTVDEAVTRYTSNRSMPATGIAFAVGNFQATISTRSNSITGGNEIPEFARATDSQIQIYSETDDTDLTELLEYSIQSYRSIQQLLSSNYPYSDLHLILLDEDFMEVKNYGAGVIFLYKSKGNIKQQINRAIAAQWAGVYLREPQWAESDAILFLQAFLLSQLGDFHFEYNKEPSPFDVLSEYELSKWVRFLESEESEDLVRNFLFIKEDLFSDDSRTLDWSELSHYIYKETGRSFFDGIQLSDIVERETGYFEYSAEINWIEDENRLEIYFTSVNDPVHDLVSVELTEVTLTGQRSHDLSFTGESDGVVVPVSPSVEYVKLKVLDRDDIKLIAQKPYLFWISQLRDDDDPYRRIEAAIGLSKIEENPDLQLALNDILRTEVNPEVYAEILRSLSKLTRGASGTDERFIQYTSSQQPLVIQLAAVEALSNFENNDRVIGRLTNIVLQTNRPEIRISAIQSLSKITDASRFRSIAQNLITRENVLNKVPIILNELGKKGDTESAIEMAGTFISGEFPYRVRKGALQLIIDYDQSGANWMRRLPDLFADRHPGIRIMAVEGLGRLNNQQRNTFLRTIADNEYDERVRLKIQDYN